MLPRCAHLLPKMLLHTVHEYVTARERKTQPAFRVLNNEIALFLPWFCETL